MKISLIEKEHNKLCGKKLILYTIKLKDSIHVELCCEVCGYRAVADVYQLEITF